MRPIIKTSVATLENREMTVFFYYADSVGEILHYYLQKTQFTVLEGIQGLVTKIINFYLIHFFVSFFENYFSGFNFQPFINAFLFVSSFQFFIL